MKLQVSFDRRNNWNGDAHRNICIILWPRVNHAATNNNSSVISAWIRWIENEINKWHQMTVASVRCTLCGVHGSSVCSVCAPLPCAKLNGTKLCMSFVATPTMHSTPNLNRKNGGRSVKSKKWFSRTQIAWHSRGGTCQFHSICLQQIKTGNGVRCNATTSTRLSIYLFC